MVGLQTWMQENWFDRKEELSPLYAYRSGINQACWVRDSLAPPFVFDPDPDVVGAVADRTDRCIDVVGVHRSKSMPLPVYGMWLKSPHSLDKVAYVVFRNNFHGWVVTVEANQPPPFDYHLVTMPYDVYDVSENDYSDKGVFHDFYAEGFPKAYTHGPPLTHDCPANYTLRIPTREALWMFLALVVS